MSNNIEGVNTYITKPCEIQAIQFTRNNFDKVVKFTEGNAFNLIIERCPNGNCYCEIKTLEGNMTATENDYIIRGLRGEYYPCKPDVFLKKYSIKYTE